MPSGDAPLVRCEALTKRFGRAPDETVALDAVDLTLSGGSFVAVTGPSGCGKSTLLNLAGLLDSPSGGRLEVCGNVICGSPSASLARLRRAKIGFLFQDAGLIAAMSAIDNIVLPLRYRGRARRSAVDAAMAELERFGLRYLVARRVESLSGGERQRVALIRAFIKQPELLICDEPTSSLDEANSRLVSSALRAYAAGGALVLCSTHDPLVIQQVTRRVRMDRGRLEAAA